MRESVANNTVSKGFRRRIFGLILFTALIPVIVTAALAFYEFERSLELGAATSINASAEDYGVGILTRLERAADKSRQIIRVVESEGVESFSPRAYLLSDFDAIWIVDAAGVSNAQLYGDEVGVTLPQSIVNDLRGVEPRLVLTSNRKLVMLWPITNGPGAHTAIAFELSAEKLWGPRQDLSYDTEYCVFSEHGVQLQCTATVDPSVHADLAVIRDNTSGIVFGDWQHQEESHIAALWQLSLKPGFGAPALDIVALRPRQIDLQSGPDSKRVLLPALFLVSLLVAIISFIVVNRVVGPLRNLTIATRQLAAGNLRSRVRIRSDDEFRWLGESFNHMAEHIGNQIATLEAMSGIDRLILTGTKLEEVAEKVVRNLFDLTGCEAAAVIARDPVTVAAGTMFSLHGDEACHDPVDMPENVEQEWSQFHQVCLAEVESSVVPYLFRFESFGQNFVVSIPIAFGDSLKGVLLLGSVREFDTSKMNLQRCEDLAGRFAVALASVEREDALYRQAHYDQLTGLPNRQLLKDRLDQNIKAARLDNQSGAILFLDLDRFKEINDVYGHSVGDAVLKQSSQRIKQLVRDRDTVARLGGDEFVVVLSNVDDDSIVRGTAKRLLDTLSEAFTVNDTDHYLSASIGITMFPNDGATVETLLKNSDAAMYRAKEAGRGRFEFFSKRLNAESRRKISIERDLRVALHQGELAVQYQPQFDIASGCISGAEALLRWRHPEQGMISPDEFIPLAEESDLIVDIGSWVLERACKDLSTLLADGLHPGAVSVNVSGRQLADTNFASVVMEPIRKYKFHPGYMQLEVTETVVAQNRDKAISILESLRKEGVRVAIDDFGTGYSSLSYLQQMPFDIIKIDKSFIDRIGTGTTSDNICRTIITMAEQLGKKSIAEGVEEEHQLTFLRENKCHFAQGFYYAEAMPIGEFREFLEKQDLHTQRRKALEII